MSVAVNLTTADLAMFSQLGITVELLERAGIQRVTDAEAREKFGVTGSGDMSGIAFPYFSPMDRVRRTCRVRRDHPEIEKGKPRKKYISAYGDRRRLYFVRGCKELVGDSTVPVVLVEGEKSALALTAWAERSQRTLLPVAIGGCWGWRGRIGSAENFEGKRVDEVGPLPELLGLCSAGRRVYVLLDANCATNPDVGKARAALARVLQKQKADVHILDVPLTDGVNGPDDYIAAHGDDAWARIFDGADEGAKTLDEVKAFLHRFVAISDSQSTAITLWVAHTFVFSIAIWTPYLAITSAMKRCGKSRLLETISYLAHRPWYTVGASAASLFREIDTRRPTLLLDETDALFKGNKEMAEAVRMILNAGAHHKGTVARVVGQGAKMTTKNFGVYCPKAFAGIGSLPDTVSDRSLHIRLERKLHGQGVERLRERVIEPRAAELRGRLAKWIEKQTPALKNSDPELPDELNDRQQDGAEILLAIADAAGGEWPTKARKALTELYTGEAAEDQSVQVRLLADIRAVFDEHGEDRVFSADLVAALAKIETSPWSE